MSGSLNREEMDAIRRIGRFMEQKIPFNRFLGLAVTCVSPNSVTLSLPFKEELVGDPQRRALHGGVLASMLDVAGGTVCWSAMKNEHSRVSTVDLRVDYLRPGRCEDVVCEATLIRLGKSVGVARMEVFLLSDREYIIATGQGVYNLVWEMS